MIPEEIYGFPGVGLGGYVCGLLAHRLGDAAEVWLRRPPPLGRPLQVERHNGSIRLLDGRSVVADGRPFGERVAVPAAVSFEEATWASGRYSGFRRHAFPMCFGCGPERKLGEGLRIFPGPVGDRDLVAAPWVPGAELGGEGGSVRPEFVWAAMDCPTVWASAAAANYMDRPAALGRMSGRTLGPVAVEEPCVVIAWPLGSEGRKSFAGGAVFGADGRLRAEAQTVWIRLS